MKAELYAVESLARWNWYYTLDPGIDRFMRFRLYDADTRLIWLEPSLSFGQAVWLANSLNDSAIPTNVSLDYVRRELIRKWGDLGIAPLEYKQASLRSCRMGTLAEYTPPLHEADLRTFIAMLHGKALLPDEIESLLGTLGHPESGLKWTSYAQAAHIFGAAIITNGIELSQRRRLIRKQPVWTCQRCGSTGASIVWTPCVHCGDVCPYCEACLEMGRSRFCTPLLLGSPRMLVRESNSDKGRLRHALSDEPPTDLSRWGLSPAQTEASSAGIRFLNETGRSTDSLSEAADDVPHDPPCFLIWAVTGAGKTEMIFPLIEHELSRGGKVLIATPRRDVVLELAPRLQKAFADQRLVTLYGGSDDRWQQGSLFLTTTHQLFRFWRAFDLVIIDELDAFPFHNSPTLEYAVRKACKHYGRYILLSATPPVPLQRLVKRGSLAHVRVPVRFHRHPLPVPKRLRMKPLKTIVAAGGLPRNVSAEMQASLSRGAQLFVFVSRIKLIEPFVAILRQAFPQVIIEGTSSQDEKRTDKVLDFRGKSIRILVTTTILERGVTVPKTDVFILDADSPLFDEASLVQMAGRAGRSKDDPKGRVFFAAPESTRAQLSAIGQIRDMNKLAAKKGYLLQQGRKEQ